MKNKILVLGKVLDKSEQKQVNGGFDVVGIKKLKCYLFVCVCVCVSVLSPNPPFESKCWRLGSQG